MDFTPWPHSAAHSTVCNALVTRDTFRLISDRWRLPPFQAHYCGWGLYPWQGKKYVVVFYKRPAQERGGLPVNVLSPQLLTQLYDALSPQYTVVYVRPPPGLMGSEDQGTDAVHDDIDALLAHAQATDGAASKLVIFPHVLREMQQEATGAGIDFNSHEALLAALADADGYVATQGGATYLSLLWGENKRVVTLEVKGLEAVLNAQQWYPRISNTSRVVSVRSHGEVLGAVRQMFLE